MSISEIELADLINMLFNLQNRWNLRLNKKKSETITREYGNKVNGLKSFKKVKYFGIRVDLNKKDNMLRIDLRGRTRCALATYLLSHKVLTDINLNSDGHCWFMCGENSVTFTMKVDCCFLEVFLDSLQLSFNQSIIVIVSFCQLCIITSSSSFHKNIVGFLRVETV